MADLPDPPPRDHIGPRRRGNWMAVAGAFALACVLPSLFFLFAAFSDDPTATGSAGDAVLILTLVAVVIGTGFGAAAWAVSIIRGATARRVATTLVLIGAGAAGLVTGFLGGIVIELDRHPTWDDA